jgi:hypothetical protein
VGAFFGAKWGISGVATATLAALLVFYLLLYTLAARVSGASLWSFVLAHAHPAMVFVIVFATAALGRFFLAQLGLPPSVMLMATVTLGVVALAGATRVLRSKLWGDFLYQQGLAWLVRHTPADAVEEQEDDDFRN